MLERFELKIDLADLSSTPAWLYRTLWRTNSPAFKEIIISISNCSRAADLRAAMDEGDWRTVDAYLYVLAKSPSSFNVVFRVGFGGDEDCVVRNLIEEHFPLVSDRGVVRVERATL
jgi:hypothetical protein